MLWCFNILLPALLLSPHPKPAEIPSKQTQPLDSSFPLSTSPALLFKHPVKFPGGQLTSTRLQTPTKALAHEFLLPTYSVKSPAAGCALWILRGVQ